jgi:predicted MFS family arabinose efflux permease
VAQQRTIIAGAAFYLLMLIAFGLVAGLGGSRLVVAFYCAQLAPVPLILGPVVARARGGYGIVNAGSALAIVAISAAIGIGAVAVHLATESEPWLWAAVPATLGAGFLLFFIARLLPARARA